MESVSSRSVRRARMRRLRTDALAVCGGTVRACFRYRVTGLAAEAAFFALLSLPPLLLGLVGTLGYFNSLIGPDTVQDVRDAILGAARSVLSERGVDGVVTPTLDTVLGHGRPDITIIGFLIALWSGSRALNVYVDTITIAYGMAGRRGIVRTRLLSFSLYLVGLVLGIVLLPLVVAGPHLVTRGVPNASTTVHALYWPVVVILSIAFLTSLYHLSVPVRTPWREDLPGAVLALVVWLSGSFLLRYYLAATVDGASPYGSLAAPVAALLWLYVTALAVLIGAALNAEVDRIWSAQPVSPAALPAPATPAAPAVPPAPAGPPAAPASVGSPATAAGAAPAGASTPTPAAAAGRAARNRLARRRAPQKRAKANQAKENQATERARPA